MSDLSRFSSASNPQNPSSRLLCLSNGHGEDIIAVRILQQLQQHSNLREIAALPLVGEGRAYTQAGIPLIGSVKTMPSGGFIYMDGRQLMRDIQGGLLKLTLAQLKAIKSWTRGDGGQGSLVLAVGDIVPLLFAWLSGADYAFVGTAKSEYYVRDETGSLPRRSLFARFDNWSGSIYHPWERWLMSRPRCKAVFPRDSLTTQTLQQWSIPAFDLGNPMMDDLEPVQTSDRSVKLGKSLTILLLPGSRPPEAYSNWEQIVMAAIQLMATFSDCQVLFLGAIAPSLSLEPLRQNLLAVGFKQVIETGLSDISVVKTIQLNPAVQDGEAQSSKITVPTGLTFKRENACVILTQHAYNNCLHLAEVAIAMAGTATEQFVGLGKPAIVFPGKGPQFTHAFAEAQSRHLGSSLILVEHPNQVADAVQSLLNEPQKLQLIAENGVRRMGKPGAARRIADCLMEHLG